MASAVTRIREDEGFPPKNKANLFPAVRRTLAGLLAVNLAWVSSFHLLRPILIQAGSNPSWSHMLLKENGQ